LHFTQFCVCLLRLKLFARSGCDPVEAVAEFLHISGGRRTLLRFASPSHLNTRPFASMRQ
jgi:hypothetical protein